MRFREHEDLRRTHLPVVKSGGKVCGASIRRPLSELLIILAVAAIAFNKPAEAQNGTFTVSAAPGGIAFAAGGGGTLSGQFGTMNALGIGTPGTGVTVIPMSNGALYLTKYQITISGLPNPHRGAVTAFVNSNFTHPAALILESCPSSSTCNASGNFSAISLLAAAPTAVVAAPGITDQTVTAGLAIFVPDNNGASSFTGVDTARITLTATDTTNNKNFATAEIRLDTPVGETVQSAVRLTLASATGGLTITPGADFSMNFGFVNGLGFNPGAGLTTVAAAGGVVYSTPYVLQPAFSAFRSTTATIKTFVSTTFAHPTVLILRDAAASAGPYNNIGTTAGTATQITTAAPDRSSITRFLGLFVSNTNGAAAFQGSDSATLTFTMTVP
ncbi:MAG TPA: hypothetical protein VN658_05205 [Candidatus Acidoferrales bacterium]|nr:hypothetical protein [Candidatus Acidoferrales bacterium]